MSLETLPALTELKINNKQRIIIKKLEKKGVQQEISTEIDKEGKPHPSIKVINSELLESNIYLMKDALILAVYKDLTQVNLDEMDTVLYDEHLNSILEFATENQILWIIDLKMCKKHLEISTEDLKKKD